MKTNLQQMRRAAGFKSAREFAEYAGLNVGTYTNYEQGKRNIDLETLCFIADKLNCSLDDLIGRPTPEGPSLLSLCPKKTGRRSLTQSPELNSISDWLSFCLRNNDVPNS